MLSDEEEQPCGQHSQNRQCHELWDAQSLRKIVASGRKDNIGDNPRNRKPKLASVI
jgi:hypothetical protein